MTAKSKKEKPDSHSHDRREGDGPKTPPAVKTAPEEDVRAFHQRIESEAGGK